MTLLSTTQIFAQRGEPDFLIYDQGTLIEGWEATTPVDGTFMEVGEDHIDFTLQAWQEGRDGWPRIRLSGQALDLSGHTMIVMEVESLSDQPQTLVATAGISNEQLSAAVVQFGPRTTEKVVLNISDGAEFDPSRTVFIHLYRQTPPVDNPYRLTSIKAVHNPDFIPARTALIARLDDLGNTLDNLSKTNPQWHADLAQARSQVDAGQPGYLARVSQTLDELVREISRTGMKDRQDPVVVWSSPLGQTIQPDTLPSPDTPALESISMDICLNDYRIFCINLTAGESPQSGQMRLLSNTHEGVASLRPALIAKARDGSLTADAMGLPAEELAFEIPSYETRQFLVWVDTKAHTLDPGQYDFLLEVATENQIMAFPVTLQVHPITLPDSPSISTFNWAVFFHSRTVTRGLEEQALANLRDYGMNTWYLEDAQVALPDLDAEGNYLGLYREKQFRQLLDLLKGHPEETFVLWLGLERGENVTRRFKDVDVIRAYLKDLHAVMDEYGIDRDKRYFTLMDEPKTEETLANIKVMQRFKEADDRARFYDNGSDLLHDPEQRQAFFDLVTIWCPNWDHFLNENLENIQSWKEAGLQKIGFYRCLMGRNNRSVNIYEYYRLAAWKALRYDFDVLGFWAYNAGHGENVWDGTTGSASGGVVVYTLDGQLLTSRRWELYREGLADLMLAELIQSTHGKDSTVNDRIHELAEQVTQAPQSPGHADEARSRLIALYLDASETPRP